MSQEDPISILTQEIDEELLTRLPKWFQRLREAYSREKKL